MTKYRFYEWDMINGEMLYSEVFDTEDEALNALESTIKDAEKRGWDCYYDGSGRYICTKCEEEEGEEYCYESELGIEEV